METLLPRGIWQRYLRRKRYQRLDGTLRTKTNVKIIRFGVGGSKPRKYWRIKAVPKFRLRVASPLKVLSKLKNAYINTMLRLAGNAGSLNSQNVFGDRRIPKARELGPVVYSSAEVENRLIYEIYLALVATRDLDPKVEGAIL